MTTDEALAALLAGQHDLKTDLELIKAALGALPAQKMALGYEWTRPTWQQAEAELEKYRALGCPAPHKDTASCVRMAWYGVPYAGGTYPPVEELMRCWEWLDTNVFRLKDAAYRVSPLAAVNPDVLCYVVLTRELPVGDPGSMPDPGRLARLAGLTLDVWLERRWGIKGQPSGAP